MHKREKEMRKNEIGSRLRSVYVCVYIFLLFECVLCIYRKCGLMCASYMGDNVLHVRISNIMRIGFLGVQMYLCALAKNTHTHTHHHTANERVRKINSLTHTHTNMMIYYIYMCVVANNQNSTPNSDIAHTARKCNITTVVNEISNGEK